MSPVRVAVVGCGAWGKNVVRDAAASPRAELVAVVDRAEDARARARSLAPHAAVVVSLREALALGVDAVIVASPPSAHEEHASEALRGGAHVLVEKPLATDEAAADRLVTLAREVRRVGLVGHILRYHPGAEQLVALVRAGAIGAVRYATAKRLSVRRASEGSVLWALGPHDPSLFRAVTGRRLARADLRLVGEDAAFVLVEDEASTPCHIELSRVHAFRARSFSVVGARGVAVLDDATAPGTLTVFAREAPDDRARLDAFVHAHAREGERVPLPDAAPLALEIDHFLRACRGEVDPRTPFEEGAEVVRVLDRAARAAGVVH